MKVTLFLGFGDLLMLKSKSQKPQLWGFGDQRGMTQMTWDQVRGGHFGHIYYGFILFSSKISFDDIFFLFRDGDG